MSKQGRASQFNSQDERDAFLKVGPGGAGVKGSKPQCRAVPKQTCSVAVQHSW
jgi:hypothetical protein